MHIHTSLLLVTFSLALAQKDFPDLADSLDSLSDTLDSPDFKSLALFPLPYTFCGKNDRTCTDGTNSGCCNSGICCGSGCANYGWSCVITAKDKDDPRICSRGADKCYDVIAEIKEEDGKTVTSTLKDAPTGTARSTPTVKSGGDDVSSDADNSDSLATSGGERLGAGLWVVGMAAAAGLMLLRRM